MVTLDEAKKYLRVDFADDDGLIQQLIDSAEKLTTGDSRMRSLKQTTRLSGSLSFTPSDTSMNTGRMRTCMS